MTGPLAEVDLALLLAFAGGALVVVWSAVVIAGFLPVKDAKGAVPLRLALIACAGLVTIILAVVLALTAPMLPTAVAVIAASAAILAGPFLVEPIREVLRDSHLILAAPLLFALAALAILPWPF